MKSFTLSVQFGSLLISLYHFTVFAGNFSTMLHKSGRMDTLLFPERREHASGVLVQNTGENSTVYTISTQAQIRRDEDASRDLSEAVFA